jgi:hypothetical protein
MHETEILINNNNNEVNNLTVVKLDFLNKISEFNELKTKLNENFIKTEEKINKQFEILLESLQTRQSKLIDELKLKYQTKKTSLDNYIDEYQKNIFELNNDAKNMMISIDQLDFDADLHNLNNIINTTNKANDQLDLIALINNYGTIIETTPENSNSNSESSSINNESIRGQSPAQIRSQSPPLKCQISGKGLVECYANHEASFILSFKNRDGALFNKSNVSFMDIYILRAEDLTNQMKINNSENKLSNKVKLTNRLYKQQRPTCFCKLERLSDGLYAVKYKLDKPGVYILNVLFNKSHIGNSPYRLVCTSRSFDLYKRPTKATTGNNSFTITRSNSINTFNNSSITSPRVDKSSSSQKTSSLSQISGNNRLPNSSSAMSINSYSRNKSALPFSSSTSTISKITKNENIIDSNPSLISESVSSFNNHQVVPILSKQGDQSNENSINEFMNNTNNIRRDDYLFRIGTRGRGIAEFLNPQAVCATDQFIYITDSNNQKIDVFNHAGDYKFSLGSSLAFNSKTIRRPCGIVATSDSKILVVDYEYKCVNVFEDSGKYVSRICQNRLLGPKGICVNRYYKNQIIVADSKGNSVCVFDSSGGFVRRFGNLGNKNENFAGPQYVACMSDGSIIITDFYNHCIKIFDRNCNFKFSFGTNGNNQGQFNGPTGVAVDSNDNIVVVDWGNSRIQVILIFKLYFIKINKLKLKE